MSRATKSTRSCSYEGCGRVHEGHGLCAGHLLQKQRGKELAPLRTYRSSCTVGDCRRRHLALGYCQVHYRAMKSGIDVTTAPNPRPRSPRGRARISEWGYRFVLIDDTHEWAELREAMQGKRRTIFEHRIVLAAKLGRPLLPTETAHHLNGDRLDNRPENLELWTRGQPPGQRVDDLISFMVEHYPDKVKAALEARDGQ